MVQSKLRAFITSRAACLMALAVTPAAAAADATEDRGDTDRCGDVNEMVWFDGTRVDNPDPEHTAGYDIRAAWLEDILDVNDESVGVTVQLRMCGDVPESRLPTAFWMVQWNLDDRCGVRVMAEDVVEIESPGPTQTKATAQAWCYDRETNTEAADWTVDLPNGALSVEGDRLTWTLTPDMFGGDRGDFLAPATAWKSVYAVSKDDRFVAFGSGGSSGDVEMYWRYMGPGGLDFAGGHEFAVGETREGTVR